MNLQKVFRAWSLQSKRSAPVLLLAAIFLSSCSHLDRSYFLRFWEYNRLAAERERAQKHPVAAEKYAREAINYAEYLGADDFRLAVSLNDLAQIYLQKRNYEKAEPFLNRALDVLEKAGGREAKPLVQDIITQEEATVLRGLGDVYYEQKDFKKALDCFSQSRKLLSRWCSDTRVDKGNPLGLDYVKSCWGQAESELKLKMPGLAQKSFGSALFIADANNFDVAEEIRQRYSELLLSNPGLQDPFQISSGKQWSKLVLKAREFYEQGQFEPSLRSYKEALAIALGMPDGDLRSAISYKGLADCYRKSGQLQNLIENDFNAVKILRQMSRPSISLLDTIYAELAASLDLSNANQKEEEILQEQLKLRKEHYPTRQTETLADLAALQLKQGKRPAALKFALEGSEAMLAFPANNRSASAACFRLSEILFEAHEYEKSEEAIRSTLRITRDVLQLNDGRTPLALFQLANILAVREKLDESANVLQDAINRSCKLPAKKQLEATAALMDFARRHMPDRENGSALRFATWSQILVQNFLSRKDSTSEQLATMKGFEKAIKEQLHSLQ